MIRSSMDSKRVMPLLDGARWDQLISQVLNALAQMTDNIIKQTGFCPVDTGRLRGGHALKLQETLVKYITNRVYYWIFIVFGHRTRGGGGYVEPDDYPTRAVVAVLNMGYLPRIVSSRVAAMF